MASVIRPKIRMAREYNNENSIQETRGNQRHAILSPRHSRLSGSQGVEGQAVEISPGQDVVSVPA